MNQVNTKHLCGFAAHRLKLTSRCIPNRTIASRLDGNFRLNSIFPYHICVSLHIIQSANGIQLWCTFRLSSPHHIATIAVVVVAAVKWWTCYISVDSICHITLLLFIVRHTDQLCKYSFVITRIVLLLRFLFLYFTFVLCLVLFFTFSHFHFI